MARVWIVEHQQPYRPDMPLRKKRELRAFKTRRQAERDRPYADTHTTALFRATLELVEVTTRGRA